MSLGTVISRIFTTILPQLFQRDVRPSPPGQPPTKCPTLILLIFAQLILHLAYLCILHYEGKTYTKLFDDTEKFSPSRDLVSGRLHRAARTLISFEAFILHIYLMYRATKKHREPQPRCQPNLTFPFVL